MNTRQDRDSAEREGSIVLIFVGTMNVMVDRMRIRPATWLVFVLLFITAISMQVQANPRPIQPDPSTSTAEFLTIFFCVNFCLNFFWFSLLLLIVLTWKGAKAGNFPSGRLRFHASTIASAAIITVVGVTIDLIFQYEYDSGWFYIVRDTGKWAVAALLVGLSVLAVGRLVQNISLNYGILPMAGMVVVNIVWWSFMDTSIFSGVWFLSFFFLLLVPLVMYELDKWHRSAFPAKDQASSDLAGHPQ